MYPATPTYWLEPAGRVAVGLRHYSRGDWSGFTCQGGYHSALVFTGEAEARFTGEGERRTLTAPPSVPHEDPRWPTNCGHGCGYEFTTEDERQDWQELIYQRTDTGELVTLREPRPDAVNAPTSAPPGASWDAWWMPDWGQGRDGIALMVRCPNGRDWHVDGRASNCTMPDDRVHKCWVRHGDPRGCHLNVDKNGVTCGAGAGSIQADDYHGFLAGGVLTAG